MRLLDEAQALFCLILGWYRDMALLQVNGSRALLIHKDCENALEQSLQRGENLPLEEVQQAIEDAKLSIERSTGLAICLETLFLRLGFL